LNTNPKRNGGGDGYIKVARDGQQSKQGDWSEALEVYNSALKEGVTLTKFSLGTLQALQTLLEQNKQPLPWTATELAAKVLRVDHRQRNSKQNVASSESDSSDSDDDKKKS